MVEKFAKHVSGNDLYSEYRKNSQNSIKEANDTRENT